MHLAFYGCSADPDPCSHACTASVLPPEPSPQPLEDCSVFRVTTNKQTKKNPTCIKTEDKKKKTTGKKSTFQKKGIASSPCAPYFCSAPHHASFRWCRIPRIKTWWTARIQFSTLARLCPPTPCTFTQPPAFKPVTQAFATDLLAWQSWF